MDKPQISVIIVHYNAEEELSACLKSIYESSIKTAFEVIVVDNDEKKRIQKKLVQQHKNLIYIPNHNTGFGAGNNKGARVAKGKYLFFVNPDTVVFPRAIDTLYTFLEKNQHAGIAAPILLHESGKEYTYQASRKLTPFSAIVALSFLNVLFPNNPVSRNYFLKDWDRKKTQEVDVVPGTAFMIRKKLFSKINGFDENFFMYFEESDLCKRLQNEKASLYMLPLARIIHNGAGSTESVIKNAQIFKRSRFYYFKKHYGVLSAFFVEFFLFFNKEKVIMVLFIGILCIVWYNIRR